MFHFQHNVIKGSFTGAISDRKGLIEQASGGTFFLDEIGDLPVKLQPKLLRVLKEAALEEGKGIPVIADETVGFLESYFWPGNVREIQNIAQRIMVLHDTKEILCSMLPEAVKQQSAKPDSLLSLPEQSFDLEEWTDKIILEALKKNNWNQSKTAKYLHISRNTLIYRMDKRPLLKKQKQT